MKEKLYHLSKNGRMEICNAIKVECPLGVHSYSKDELQELYDETNLIKESMNKSKKVFKRRIDGELERDTHHQKIVSKGTHLEELYGKSKRSPRAYTNNSKMRHLEKTKKDFKDTLNKFIENPKNKDLIRKLKKQWIDIANAEYYEKRLLEERKEADEFIRKFSPIIVETTYAEFSPSTYISVHKSSLPFIKDYLERKYSGKKHEDSRLPQLILKPNIDTYQDDTRYNDLVVIRFSDHIPKLLLKNTTFVETPEKYFKMTEEEKRRFDDGVISTKIKKKETKRKMTKEQLMNRLKESILVTTNPRTFYELPINAPELNIKNSKKIFEETSKGKMEFNRFLELSKDVSIFD